MLGILGETYMIAARTDRFRQDRRVRGTIETPASHDPEREWIDDDRRRRLYGRDAARAARRRADLRFWRQRRSDAPADGND
ncbi:hypothetical protein [Acidimangrovimonas sediminis]|uniref:hypothetical protein n=1 Tax=Acidimangrovimonas sediminis TaxID=2056283 RepID=UPI000C800287|nr:hypothetical protein [Acidimangrovimonas sediminis]